jgi:PAS domain-containing protein
MRPDGTRLHCLNHASPIDDTAGQRLGSVGLWIDLSVRRRAELVLRSFELVVNSITDLVSVVDERRVYRLVNDAWCAAVGMKREQALGRTTDELLPGGGGELRRQALSNCLQTQQVSKARAAIQGPGQVGKPVRSTCVARSMPPGTPSLRPTPAAPASPCDL